MIARMECVDGLVILVFYGTVPVKLRRGQHRGKNCFYTFGSIIPDQRLVEPYLYHGLVVVLGGDPERCSIPKYASISRECLGPGWNFIHHLVIVPPRRHLERPEYYYIGHARTSEQCRFLPSCGHYQPLTVTMVGDNKAAVKASASKGDPEKSLRRNMTMHRDALL